MSDKKKSELSVVPEFVDGEQPTAAKLNSIGSLLKREGFILEKSVGDIWGESEPYSDVSQNLLSSPIMKEESIDNLDESQDGNGRSLDIVNLGRAIGPMSKLNPKVLTQGLSSGRTAEIREEIPAGVYEYKMKMPVDWSQAIAFPPADDAYEIRVSSLADLNGEGDYYVDEEKNTVYSYLATSSSAYPYVTYKTTPSEWASGSSYSMSNFNTIPDISQIGYSDLSISQNAQGLYEFVFPEVTHTSRADGDSSLIEGNSPLFGSTYTLPASIRAVCGGNYFAENSGITNTVIPEGMIYLKNAVTGEIYSDATYYYNSDSSVLVEGVELDLDDNYYFITVGTDLTSCIEDIYNKLGNHSHDGKYGEKSISVKDICDNYLSFDNDQKVYLPSTKEGNHFSQYLHRDGYISGDPHNDGNAMRGDLVIGRRASSAGNYIGAGRTYRIGFGDSTGGQSIYRDEDDDLIIRSQKYSNDVSYSQLKLDEDGYGYFHSTGASWVSGDNAVALNSNNGHVVSYSPFLGEKGIIAAHQGSTFAKEVPGVAIASREWFHPKISTIHWYANGEKVYASTNAGGTPSNSNNYLSFLVELPAGFMTNAGTGRILGVDLIWAETAIDTYQLRDNDIHGVSSYDFFKGARHSAAWKLQRNNTGSINQLVITIPTDAAPVTDGDGGVYDHTHLSEEEDTGYKYTYLNIAVTIRYRGQ